MALLDVKDLSVAYFDGTADVAARQSRREGKLGKLLGRDAGPLNEYGLPEGWIRAVHGVSFSVEPGEVLALVGESGSGKTLMAMGSINLLPPGAQVIRGTTSFDGRQIMPLGRKDDERAPSFRADQFAELDDEDWRRTVGPGIGVIFQNPHAALSPLHLVGTQSGEVLEEHTALSEAEVRERVFDALGEVQLHAKRKFGAFRHELSRGEAQRTMLAAALLSRPRLLIADEPLSGLDATVGRAILDLINDLRRKRRLGMLLVTHDLGVVASIADRVGVVYGGRIVEMGTATDIFRSPKHPYTAGLLASIPALAPGGRLRPIPGDVPELSGLPPGCPFQTRCEHAVDTCRTEMPPVTRVQGSSVRCWRATELNLTGVGGSPA
ncbi:MAG: ABC transporter ATP-binding protein [Acidimicrobiia bacterium]|nr:ABC transporter ATP-binding protein [Acidimicrobiia bacterium]NNC73951.1 ABC transporter ATP-binding protein [Acidimicrobiia bacterium]